MNKKFKEMYEGATRSSHYQRNMPEDDAIIWAYNRINRKCLYIRGSKIEQYTPECCIVDYKSVNEIHPDDIEGEYCQFCGGKIKKKTDERLVNKYLSREDYL